MLQYQAEWIGAAQLTLDLPPIAGERLRRVEVADPTAGSILLDTGNTSGVTILDENKVAVDARVGVDLSMRRRLFLQGVPRKPADGFPLVVRLWSDDGRLLATVPVVTSGE